MPVDPTRYGEYVDAIEKAYGKGVIRSGDTDPDIERVSFGSHELDHITGGGAPLGRFIRFYGGYSSGKSLSCWNVAKNAMALRTARFPKGLEVVYYNLEKQYDRKYCLGLGIDVKRMKIVNCDTIEDCGTILHDLMDAAHVHIIDSCSAVPSIDEFAKDLDQHTMGLSPKVWGRVLRRALKKMDTKENMVILVDQIRDVFGSGGVAPPGGRQMEHISSLSLMFRRGAWLHHDANGILDPDAKPAPTLSGNSDPRGMEIQVRCEKSRVCRPLRSARMRLDLRTGEWDLPYELAKAGLYFDDEGKPAHETGKPTIIVQTATGRYQLEDGTKIHGKKKLREAIESSPELQTRIAQTMMIRG